MGTIESIDVSIDAHAADEEATHVITAPAVTSGVNEQGMAVYTYATDINVMNAKKPSLADYTNTETVILMPDQTTETTTVTTVPVDFEMGADDFDYTVPLTTSAPAETTTEATTTALTTAATSIMTTAVPSATYNDNDDIPDIEDDPEETEPDEDDIIDITTEDTTQPPEITTTPDNSPAPVETAPPVSANDEIFTVNAAGTIITDSALNIVSMAVMAEISDVFDDEAIKAQAIATYTYIKYYNMNNQNAYIAKSTPTQRVKDLVSQVLGKALYYNGTMIQAVYTASTAGRTASSKNVWGVDYPYLQSKDTSFIDKEYDINYGRQLTFTSEEIKNYVKNSTGIILDGDPSNWIKIESYLDEIYVGQMSIGGHKTYNNGTRDVTITGRVFRETIMDYDIRSSCFEISYDPASDTFTITTYGYGHCVGFSQHGANILASKFGYTYDQILQFYYPGTEIK